MSNRVNDKHTIIPFNTLSVVFAFDNAVHNLKFKRLTIIWCIDMDYFLNKQEKIWFFACLFVSLSPENEIGTIYGTDKMLDYR